MKPKTFSVYFVSVIAVFTIICVFRHIEALVDFNGHCLSKSSTKFQPEYHCNETKHLECNTKRKCTCKTSSDPKYLYVFHNGRRQCELIQVKDKPAYDHCNLEFHRNLSNIGYDQISGKRICKLDYDCPGNYTKCDLNSCSCVCQRESLDPINGKLYTVTIKKDQCVLIKKLGDSCNNDEECNLTIDGEAICAQNITTGTKICQCGLNFIQEEDDKCLSKIGNYCVSDKQCQAEDALGPFSFCHGTSKFCTCISGTKRIGNKCYQAKNIGESCNSNYQCLAGVKNSLCQNNVCHCNSTYLWEPILKECLQPAGHIESCEVNLQCVEALGVFSECSLNKTCECKSLDDGAPIGYIHGKGCLHKKFVNETCHNNDECLLGSSNSFCNDNKNCECNNGFILFEEGKKCVHLSRFEGPCLMDMQCTMTLGPFSKCINGTCNCSSTSSGNNALNKSVGFHPNLLRCIHRKSLNETCLNDAECNLGGGPFSFCSVKEGSLGACNCKSGTFWKSKQVGEDEGFGKCLEIRSLGDHCEDSLQCSHESALGQYGTCKYGLCRCLNSSFGDYNGKCYKNVKLNKSCVRDEECFVGSGIDGTTATTDIEVFCTNDTKICTCKNETACPFNNPLHLTAASAKLELATWIIPVLIACCVFVIAVSITALLTFYTKWRTFKSKSLRSNSTSSSIEFQTINSAYLLKNLGDIEVLEDDFDVDLNEELGKGRTGIVYRGYFKKINAEVAIKTNRDQTLTESYLKSMFEEAKVLVHLGEHKNITKLYGICQETINKGNVYLLSEICTLGSLQQFLRTNRCTLERHLNPTRTLTSTDRSDYRLSQVVFGVPFTIDSLYNWAYQIAEGMEFIASKSVIHSDLAARNILLSDPFTVKLTDFGLSRRLYDGYTYQKMTNDPLPWKWLDPAALRFFIFTTFTDVWSFGIVLFEIFTLGEIPYPGFFSPNEQNFVDELEMGLRPTKPKYASDNLYELMHKCWNGEKQKRPNFTFLKEALHRMLLQCSDKNNTTDVDYSGYLLPSHIKKHDTGNYETNSTIEMSMV